VNLAITVYQLLVYYKNGKRVKKYLKEVRKI